jgi:hypothetical protein
MKTNQIEHMYYSEGAEFHFKTEEPLFDDRGFRFTTAHVHSANAQKIFDKLTGIPATDIDIETEGGANTADRLRLDEDEDVTILRFGGSEVYRMYA